MSTIYFTAKIVTWLMTAMLVLAGAMLYCVIFMFACIVAAIDWTVRAMAREEA